MNKYFTVLFFLALVFSVSAATNAVPKNPLAGTNAVPKKAPAVVVKWEELKPPGNQVMALARDGAGNVWAGTEGKGVWQYKADRSQEIGDRIQKPGSEAGGGEKSAVGNRKSAMVGGGVWKQFTTKDGLGDDYAYALAVDQQGRVWVGHLNHGVSVFNGTRWKNYDVPYGPIGERVFKIAVCPTDGDVWLATSLGLTRYSVSRDAWKHFTKQMGDRRWQIGEAKAAGIDSPQLLSANSQLPAGLPSDQINSIAFDKAGNIFVGTQCDGVAMASRAENYQDWKRMPTNGLPSLLINDLLVVADGTVYAATTAGLAWSRAESSTWQCRRGVDALDKLKGLAVGAVTNQVPFSSIKKLLPKDFVTCLTEDVGGVVWLGFRGWAFGVQPWHHPTKEFLTKVPAAQARNVNYTRDILPLPDGRLCVAGYGQGLMQTETPVWPGRTNLVISTNVTAAYLPTPARAPSLAELTAMLATVKNLAAEKAIPTNWRPAIIEEAASAFPWHTPNAYYTNAAYLGEDWRSQGDWTGRYGWQDGKLCSASAPFDHPTGWSWRINIDPHMGAHHQPGDSLRYFINSARVKTEDPRCPYSTVVGHRRIGEWDDHGEAYPVTYEGPDVWIKVGLPDGVFRVSVYFCNYNGNTGRDYLLELKPYVTNALDWDKQPTLAQCRVQDFVGGVYKSFIVTGAGMYHFKIGRNYSYNTMCNAVFVDRLVGFGWHGSDNSWPPYMEHTFYFAPTVPPADPARETPELLKARELWSALENAYAVKPGVAMQNEFRLAAYQAALAAHAPADLLTNWRWKMAWWTPEDRQEQHATLKAAYEKRTEMVRKHQPF